MSNYLFSGYSFSSDLKAKFKLQNLLQTQESEEQQMSLQLLNKQSEGFEMGTKTPYNQNPQFVIDQIIGGSTQNLITIDSSTSQLQLNLNVDLGNVYKIQNSIEPTDNRDLANKLYVDSLARLRTIGIATNTNALSITKNTDVENPIFNIDISNQLQNFSDLSSNGLVHRIGVDTFTTFAPSATDGQVLTTNDGTFAWENLERVTSIGLTTASTGLSITNTPITDSGNINIDLSVNLESISNLNNLGLVFKDDVNTFNTISLGSAGQFLGINNSGSLEWQNTGTVTSVAMTTSSGLSVTGSPVTTNGTFELILDSSLQNFNNLSTDGLVLKNGSNYSTSIIPTVSGQILQTNGTGVEWITPEIGGNVVGSGTSTLNSLPQITNTTTTAIAPSAVLVENDTNLNIPGLVKVDTLKTTNDQDFISYNSTENRTYMYKSLRIPENTGYSIDSAFGFLNNFGQTGTSSGLNIYSIECHDRILAKEFNAHSSKTIKNILGKNKAVTQEALDFFDRLDIAKYQYKDIIKEGDHEYFGVIAEELKEVLPHYVNDHYKFIPNIYCKGTVKKSFNEYYITIDGELPDIKGDKVQVYTDDKCLELEIKRVDSSILSTTTDTELPKEVFVYGTYEYSPTVAYNKLWGLGFVALKGIKNKMEFLEKQVQKLTSQIKN